MKTDDQRKSFAFLAFSAAFACGAMNSVAFAYGEWLRFTSPRAPSPSSGQVVCFKGVHSIYYITPEQAFFATGFFLPLWVGFATASVIAVWLNGWEGTFAPSRMDWVAWLSTALLSVAVGTMLVTILAGDQVVSLALTGSLPPAELPPPSVINPYSDAH